MLWQLLLVSLLLPAFAATPARGVALHPPGEAIASGHALATEAGMQVLHEGGNAFDAAVAARQALEWMDSPA